MKHVSMSSKDKQKRERVIKRLEAQLVKGTKTTNFRDGSGYLEEPLTESDIKRIKSEISILKTRI